MFGFVPHNQCSTFPEVNKFAILIILMVGSIKWPGCTIASNTYLWACLNTLNYVLAEQVNIVY